MKICNAIVALCLAGEASAFMAPAPQQTVTSLKAKPFSYLSDTDKNTDTDTIENAHFVTAKGATAPKFKAATEYSTRPRDATAPKQDAPRSNNGRSIWEKYNPIICQGGSLRTFSFTTPSIERVQVIMKTEGRPLNANVDLWQGPDNTPQKMAVYIEDGDMRPFCAVIETPRGENTIAIRNTGQVEFPLAASVEAEIVDSKGNCASRLAAGTSSMPASSVPRIIQGGALKTYSFDPNVSSIQIMLKTDGRPLNARIELLQGPNNNKQVVELYTEDGLKRPFYAVVETPGNGNVVRVINTAPVEFPMNALVEPFMIDNEVKDAFVVSSGGGGWDNGSRF